MCDSGRNRGQLPSFCKQFNFVSISTASCNGQSASAALETKTILFVNHSFVPSVGLECSCSDGIVCA